MSIKVAIIGGGVNGLSCGVQISEYFKNKALVTIISENFTPNTTGDGSAGLWGPYLLGTTNTKDIWKWSKIMHDFLEKLWVSGLAGKAGVCLLPVIRVTTSSKLDDFWKDIVYGFKRLSKEELSLLGKEIGKSFTDGVSFVTYTSEPVKLLPYLAEIFEGNGGKFIEEKVNDLKDFITNSEYDIIINCTGLSARNLLNDEKVHPIRGQVSRVKAKWLYSVYLDESDDGHYIIPNCDSVVLGGTHQINDYSTLINAKDKYFIDSGCYNIMPALKNAKVLKDWVGLRPGRTSVRLEKELYDNGKIVIHNYGHGGSGVTMCWGCASDVLELMKIELKL